MASIPNWLWLIAGIIVIFFSKYVGGKIEFFFWAGLVFAIIGLAKMLIGYIMHKGETTIEKKTVGTGSPFYPAPAAAPAAAHGQAGIIRFCPRCGTALPHNGYFCHACGLRLR